MTRPERSIELFKYQGLIHDCSQWYEWSAVLSYDFYFRQSMAEDPTQSWGITDTELYMDCFTDKGLKSVVKNPQKLQTLGQSKFNRPCFTFNKGMYKWKNCRYLHQCNICGKKTTLPSSAVRPQLRPTRTIPSRGINQSGSTPIMSMS